MKISSFVVFAAYGGEEDPGVATCVRVHYRELLILMDPRREEEEEEEGLRRRRRICVRVSAWNGRG